MSFLWLFDTAGLVFGPAILLAGAAALGVCLYVSLRRGDPRRGGLVLIGLLPFAVAVCAMAVGGGFWLSGAMPDVTVRMRP